jgi:hypothetical protein
MPASRRKTQMERSAPPIDATRFGITHATAAGRPDGHQQEHSRASEGARGRLWAADRPVLAIEGELEIAEHEAAESIADRDRYEAGYHQGWADAIRVILGAIGPDGTGT